MDMDIQAISAEDIFEYSDYVDSDIAENMNRIYYHGMAGFDCEDGSLLSILIWELKSVDEKDKPDSELKWLYVADPSVIVPLFECYREAANEYEVKKTSFEFPSSEEKEEALADCGFSINQTESKTLEVTLKECADLSIAKKAAPGYVQSIEELDEQDFLQGLMNILFNYESPALEDISFIPKQWYEQAISCCIKTDENVSGMLLIHACPSGALIPVLFFAVGADSRMNLLEMMRYSIRKAAECYPEDTVVRIHRRNDSVKALSKKLFPGKKGEPAIAGERMEEEY